MKATFILNPLGRRGMADTPTYTVAPGVFWSLVISAEPRRYFWASDRQKRYSICPTGLYVHQEHNYLIDNFMVSESKDRGLDQQFAILSVNLQACCLIAAPHAFFGYRRSGTPASKRPLFDLGFFFRRKAQGGKTIPKSVMCA